MWGALIGPIIGSIDDTKQTQQAEKEAAYSREGALTPEQNRDLFIFIGLILLLVFLVILFKFI